MLVLAHRGYHAHVPENTLAAFEAAAGLGVDGIETDVRLTRDGVPVLCHDRTVDGERQVAETTRSELEQALGHPVPTLDQVLDRYPGVLWNVEIKTAEALPAALEILRPRLASHRLLVTSFRHDVAMECARRLQVDCGLLMAHRPARLDALLAECRELERLTHLVWDYNVLDEALIGQARAAGCTNFVYGVVTRSEHVRCIEIGLDGLITDYPSRARIRSSQNRGS